MGRSPIIDLEVYIHHQTEGAILVSSDDTAGEKVWLPKSVVEINGDPTIPGDAEISLPRSYAEEKGLA